MQSNEFSDGSGLELYDYGARMYDQQIVRWGTVVPKASKFSSYSSYAYWFNNPIFLTEPYGQEPIKPLAGTVASIICVFNNTPSEIWLTTGAQSGQALLRLGSTEFSRKQMRSLPTSTPYFNIRNMRYVYTGNVGWIDMVHFLFLCRERLLLDLGIKETEEGPLYYQKRDSLSYLIWFGTSLAESETYYSDSKKWEDHQR